MPPGPAFLQMVHRFSPHPVSLLCHCGTGERQSRPGTQLIRSYTHYISFWWIVNSLLSKMTNIRPDFPPNIYQLNKRFSYFSFLSALIYPIDPKLYELSSVKPAGGSTLTRSAQLIQLIGDPQLQAGLHIPDGQSQQSLHIGDAVDHGVVVAVEQLGRLLGIAANLEVHPQGLQ